MLLTFEVTLVCSLKSTYRLLVYSKKLSDWRALRKMKLEHPQAPLPNWSSGTRWSTQAFHKLAIKRRWNWPNIVFPGQKKIQNRTTIQVQSNPTRAALTVQVEFLILANITAILSDRHVRGIQSTAFDLSMTSRNLSIWQRQIKRFDPKALNEQTFESERINKKIGWNAQFKWCRSMGNLHQFSQRPHWRTDTKFPERTSSLADSWTMAFSKPKFSFNSHSIAIELQLNENTSDANTPHADCHGECG